MPYNISEVISNTEEEWIERKLPFTHFYLQDFFASHFYNQLSIDFHSRTQQKSSTQQNLEIFDLDTVLVDSLCFFSSSEWMKFIASKFDLPLTNYINIGLHRHAINSPTGWIHNDLNPGWFISNKQSEPILPSPICNYKNGNTTNENISKIKVVRSIAIIIYLNNPQPSEMDGGETGLFANPYNNPNQPNVKIPAENNSILIFPCSPNSFHTFITNKNFVRNSIIMWFHSPIGWAVTKWGKQSIIEWNV